MSTQAKKVVVICLWVLSLVTVAAIARAQVQSTVPLASPIVVSGSDVGFRIEGRQGSAPVGHLVIRQNGQWVDAAFAAGTPRIAAN